MAQIEVAHEVHENKLKLELFYPPLPDLTYNFQMTVVLYEQSFGARVGQKIYSHRFLTPAKQIIIEDLKYLTMYKIEITNKYHDSSKRTKNLFINTPSQGIEDAQSVIVDSVAGDQGAVSSFLQRPSKTTIRNSQRSLPRKQRNSHNANKQLSNSELTMKMIGKCERLGSTTKMHNMVLEARKCRTMKQFINEKQGRRINREQVMNKKMLLAKGMLLFADIYQYREGHKFFRNDWFMGPFYSYDANQEVMKDK